jgi:NADPH2 dehydrogenase
MIILSYLFSPLDKGRLTLKNRLIMPPMATARSNEDGSVSRELLNYYDEKSKGGYLSLIIIEHSYVSKQGKASERQLSIVDDNVINKLKKLSDVIHKNGTKAVMQINHAGSAAMRDVTGFNVKGPSAIINPRKGDVPAELSEYEINEIIEEFKNAAIRVKKAGFDGVEIHSAHGYLLNQFFSPLTNRREDEYGGDVYGRIKIHLDIIKAVRDAVGDDFPILLRLGASDYIDGGTTIEDSRIAAAEFVKAGVDIVDISGGFCGYVVSGLTSQGYFSSLSSAIKEVVPVPVILTGGVTDASAADKLLSEKKADLIGVGRAILKDSNWAKNAYESLK